jgi:N-acetylglucosaminyldiphosphoundecaprenol N-acetyl-beta-D-mannosaminyltransferase
MKDYFEKLYKNSAQSFKKTMIRNLKQNKKMFIVTANPETFMYAKKKNEFSELLLDPCTTLVADGIGLVKAANYLGFEIEERIPGIDLATHLLKHGHRLRKTIYLFGARQEVVDQLIAAVKVKYPNLNIIGSSNGYVENKDIIFNDIKSKKPDIILVAMGIPLQEELIYKHLSDFDKGIFVGVGGSFDVICGYKKRAPKIIRKLNLEWLYRLVSEPTRIKRFYYNNIKFFFSLKK